MSEDLFDSDPADTATGTDQPVTIRVDDTEQLVHDEITPRDLKQRDNVADRGQFTYRGADGKLHDIPDDEPVLDHVKPGETVNVQPVQGDVFGRKNRYSVV